MTNGEMIQKVFNCEVCAPIIEDDIIHVIFADKNDSAIGFDWSWWSTEYKEPTTKNDLGVDCINRATVLHLINDVKNSDGFKDYSKYEYLFDQVDRMPSVTPQEPKTGHWIDDEFGSKCSCCGIHTHLDKFDRPMKFWYCSMCGAKMVEPLGSEDKQ